MAREKIKFALRIAPETQQLVKELCERDNCQSQNEFIEKAIRFYAGYVSGKEALEAEARRLRQLTADYERLMESEGGAP